VFRCGGKAWIVLSPHIYINELLKNESGVLNVFEERIMDEKEKTLFDYEVEWHKIENRESSSILKLPIGIHKLIVISEPEKTFYTDEQTKETTEQIKLKVSYNNKEYDWFIALGKTEVSLYAQLIYVGRIMKGLRGRELELVVNTTINKKGETVKKYELLNFVRLKQLEAQSKMLGE
jgi:hypothetical protein